MAKVNLAPKKSTAKKQVKVKSLTELSSLIAKGVTVYWKTLTYTVIKKTFDGEVTFYAKSSTGSLSPLNFEGQYADSKVSDLFYVK